MKTVCRTCQSLLAGLVTVSIGAHTCQGQIPIVENNRAPVVQVAPVVKAKGNLAESGVAPTGTSPQAVPIPVIKSTPESGPLERVSMLQPMPAPTAAGKPVSPGLPAGSLIPEIPKSSPGVALSPIPVVKGSNQEPDRPIGSMVVASSPLPVINGSRTSSTTPIAPPRIGLPNQPVFDGSWTPVPPEPVSSSSLRVQASQPLEEAVSGKYVQESPGVDGPVVFQSEAATANPCDCGSASCNECGRFGFAGRSRPVLGHHRVAGSRLLNHAHGRIGGILGKGTHYGMNGFCPDASRYLIVDGMIWSRSDGEVYGNNFGGVGDANVWDAGFRVTAGERRDSVSGVELTYLGITPITDSLTSTSGGGNINASFTPSGGFNAVQTGSFYNATQAYQESKTQLHSLGINRMRYAWDVASTHLGLRYIWLEDDYLYRSTSAAGTGVYSNSSINQMIGPEAGLDLFYDVGRKVSFSGFGKIGGYLNFTRFDTDLVNNGTTFINNRNTGTELSATGDLGGNVLFHISQNARLRFGYNAMWLWGVTSYDANFPTFMSPTTGQSPDNSNTTFLHGANFGIEIYR